MEHGIIMDTTTIQIISFQMVALVAILGFLWRLHHDLHNDMADLRKEVGQDMADLRQDVSRDTTDLRERMATLESRMAKVEGLLEGLVGHPPEPQT